MKDEKEITITLEEYRQLKRGKVVKMAAIGYPELTGAARIIRTGDTYRLQVETCTKVLPVYENGDFGEVEDDIVFRDPRVHEVNELIKSGSLGSVIFHG